MFSPDGKNVVTSDAEQSYVWDFSDATIRYPLPCGSCPMVFSPDSRTLIAAPGEVLFLQVATGDELITFPHYGYDSRTLAITLDGKIIAQAGGNRDESNGIWIWNAKKRRLIPKHFRWTHNFWGLENDEIQKSSFLRNTRAL